MTRTIAVAFACLVLTGSLVPPLAVGQSFPFRIDRSHAARLRSEATLRLTLGFTETRRECSSYKVTSLVEAPSDQSWRMVEVWQAAPHQTLQVNGVPNSRVLLVLQCPSMPGYVLHGPVWWRMSAAQRPINTTLRRTVRVHAEGPWREVPTFVTVEGSTIVPWPLCTLNSRGFWECIGVPTDRAGLAVLPHEDGVAWQIAEAASVAIQSVTTQYARWGRMVQLLGPSEGAFAEISATILRERKLGRAATTRVVLVPDPTSAVYRLGPSSLWVVGHRDLENRVLELRGAAIATHQTALSQIVDGPALLPYYLHLSRPHDVSGQVLDGRSRPVAAALVTLFESSDSRHGGKGDRGKRGAGAARQRWVAEVTTDDQGRFRISGLSRKVYEFVVVHAVQGRVLARRLVDGRTVVLRLREMPRVRGRVLIDQSPAAGVPIRAVPHQRDFERARDPIGFVAPGVVTGIDGRFDLSVPPRGAGELLIGGREVGIVRYPYATTGQLPMVSELGDIVLSGPREVLVQLDHGPCELSAAGPVGLLGIEIIEAVSEGNHRHRLRVPEPGFWWLRARCGGEDTGITPPFVRVEDQPHQPIINRMILDAATSAR